VLEVEPLIILKSNHVSLQFSDDYTSATEVTGNTERKLCKGINFIQPPAWRRLAMQNEFLSAPEKILRGRRRFCEEEGRHF